ncbi:pentatricopeptide repeat-containing protein At3g16610-like [Elaeis guineensis]|uniref:Pentatricopeptide repeat-containing protein At3g16610-like n=1 Tax=Elaeis guineensis var. tenera TaxID=51953 RepID=A0A6I9QH40_ELAGV|nr:pentatricopeptide repeat-containing protein At3g16610-like [Elaeis guineensis]
MKPRETITTCLGLYQFSAPPRTRPRLPPSPHSNSIANSPPSPSPTSQYQESHLPKPSSFSHRTLFLHLRSTTSPHEARKLHGLILVHGYLHQKPSLVLGSQLVNIYVSLDCFDEALLVFHQLPKRNSFAWNSILKGFVNAGRFSEVLAFYRKMTTEGLPADNFTYPLVLKACSELSALEQGRQVQESIESNSVHCDSKSNLYVRCALIDMFAKCGSLREARRVFDDMPMRDVVSWGAMICGTMHHGDWLEALNLFRSMRLEGIQTDSVIVATVLPACGRLGALHVGMGLHGCAIRSGFGDDLCVSNALIDMYCKCGYTPLAHHLFRSMEYNDVVSWSSLIAGYSQNCEYSESVDLFIEMMGSGVRPSSVTIASVLPSFSEGKLLKQGKEIHGYAIRHGFEFDVFIASALVDLYCQSGSMREAEFIFEIMSDRDIAIGNSILAGYATNGNVDFAFQTLRRIRESGLHPNSVTMVTVLPLCNRFTMLNQGKELHGYVTRASLDCMISVNNSLIDMYCKCGCLDLGKKVFEQMTKRDIVTYNTIIAAFGMHGHGIEAFSFFSHMEGERIVPDKVTFIALLSACSHAGLLRRGLHYYNSMIEDYGILPEMEHYSCMVDLYSRSGYLDEAWEFIRKMPVKPDIDVLGSLLGACRVYKRLDLAELVSKQIFERKPEDPGYYILLSNIYAAAGRWADVMNVRTMVKDRGLMKKPGSSWIQIGSSIHPFLARDRSLAEFDQIYDIIGILLLEMREEGYVPDMSFPHNLAEDDFTYVD